MNKIYIYLAGPIRGKTEAGACVWRDQIREVLAQINPAMIGVSPLRCERPQDDGNYPVDYSYAFAHEITAKNLLDVRRCDVVLAYLPDASSIGTLQEIGWAVGLEKPVIVVSADDAVLTHPVLMATVPFLFDCRGGKGGWKKALSTIKGLFEVYCA